MSVPTAVRPGPEDAESVDSRSAETASPAAFESDAALVRRFVRERDAEAFAELHRRHEGLIRGLCARLLARPEDREDAYQATFMAFLLRADTIRKRESTACWLYGVAYRVARRLQRRRSREPISLLAEPEVSPPEAWEVLHRRHLCETVDAEIEALPPRDRLAIAMHYLMGRSQREIGETLGLSAAAVDGRIKRARQKLRQRLMARGIGLSTALAFLAACLRDAQASAAFGGSASIDSFVAGDLATSPFSSTAQGLFSEDRSMNAMSWTRNFAAAGGVALACCGVAGVFWGGSGGPTSTAYAQMGGGGFGGEAPRPGGPIVTVKLAGEQTEPAKAEFFAPLSQPSPTLDKLMEGASLDFLEQPLEVILDAISQQHSVEFQIDRKALQDTGSEPDYPVTISTNTMTLGEALDAMLSQSPTEQATYVAKDGYIVITTNDRASEMTETRMYALSDHPLLRGSDSVRLAEAIEQHVDPAAWSSQGGAGSVSLLPGVLIVTSDQKTLSKVEAFLEQYGRLLAAYQPAEGGPMMDMSSGGMGSMASGYPGMMGGSGGFGGGQGNPFGMPPSGGPEGAGFTGGAGGIGLPGTAPPSADNAPSAGGAPGGLPGSEGPSTAPGAGPEGIPGLPGVGPSAGRTGLPGGFPGGGPPTAGRVPAPVTSGGAFF